MQRTVLIVDDIAINRIVLKKALCQDYDVIEATNGKEALDFMRQSSKTLSAVLLDIVMPVMDGYETLHHMREDAALTNIPVIMITGNEDENSRVKALSLGANDFVVKPYNSDILRHCLKNNIALSETVSIINAIQRDKLTGLFIRETFFDKVTAMIQDQEPGYYVMASFDVNGFKLINEQYGTAEGDRILRLLGKILNENMVRVGGIACRLSADNFAALYPASQEPKDFTAEIINNPETPEYLHFAAAYSIGRYRVTDTSLSAAAIYDRSYIAKKSVKGRFDVNMAYFDDSMLNKIVNEQQIITEMDNALAQQQFETWFQPQYNHATGAIIGAEALVRWRHPQKGLMMPGDFIPVFEQNGFIYELDKFVCEDSCRYLRKWLDDGDNPPPVSVNISRHDIFRADFFDFITGLLQKYDLPAEMLRLEITESAFSDSSEQIISVVKKLITAGFTVEIDDFGSGYSSLNILKDVPAQIIKLDMKFLTSCDDSQRGGNIVESVIRMAKWLGMSVIAEGVEMIDQANYLLSIGCSYIQGYLYAKPMPAPLYEEHCRCISKEGCLLSMETVENLNNNSFWDPKSMDTLIFNSYVGAACIFEYHNSNVELLRANTKFTAILGNGAITVDDILKLDWIACLSPDSLRLAQDILRKSAETGDEYTEEYEFMNIPGCPPVTYLRATMRVIATTGARMLIYCTGDNITAQREAEKRELLATEQIKSMMDDMPGGFVKMSVANDGSIKPVYINEGYMKLVGISSDKLTKAYSSDFLAEIHPDDVDLLKDCIVRMLQDSQPQNIRFRQRHVNGSYIWLSIVGRVTQDTSGNSFLNVYYSDATQQIKEEETQKKLLDNLPCGAGVYEFRDGEMRLVYQNKSYWDLVGLHKATFIDPAPMSAIHPEDIPVIMQELTLAIQQNRDVSCNIRLRHLTRDYLFVHLAGRIIHEKSGGISIYATFTPNEQSDI